MKDGKGRIHAAAVAAGLLLLAVCGVGVAAPSHGAPGTLDRTFGKRGKTSTSLVGLRVFVAGVARAANGGFYVAANSGGPPLNIIGGRLLLLRYDRQGRLVRSFGERGVASYTLPEGPATVASIARQADGRLVVAGSVAAPGQPGNRSVLVARFMPNGALDPTFGGDGVATTDLEGTGDTASDLALQPDGGVVVAGSVTPDGNTGRTGQAVVIRYTTAGGLDSSFGVGGVVLRTLEEPGGFMRAEAIELESDGGILVGGNLGISQRGVSAPMLARLDSNGDFDDQVGRADLPGVASYGDDRALNDIAVDRRSGRVYLAGSRTKGTGTRTYLAGVRPNLTRDGEFGRRGVATDPFRQTTNNVATSVVVDSGGRIVVAGTAAAPPTGAFAVARYTRSGRPDKSFSRQGGVSIKIGTGWNVARAVALWPRGKLLVVGNNQRGASVVTAPRVLLARIAD